MKKHSIFRKKRSTFRKKRKTSQKKYRHKRTNKKIFKGGFNSAQLAGAIAVAGFYGMNKLVLIRKRGKIGEHGRMQGGINRYEIILNPNEPRPTLNRQQQIRIGRGNLNIRNFDIYVGSENNNLLIQITGNEGVLERLNNLVEVVAQPANALALYQNRHLELPAPQANADQIIQYAPAAANLVVNQDDNQDVNMERILFAVNILFSIIWWFFKLLYKIIIFIIKQNTSVRLPAQAVPRPIDDLALVPRAVPRPIDDLALVPRAVADEDEVADEDVEEIPNDRTIINAIVNYNPENRDQNLDILINNYWNNIMNNIEQLPQFMDNGGDNINITEPVDNTFKCVRPYNRLNATGQDRVRSCNKIGPPDPMFINQRYANLQSCANNCFEE